MKNRLSYDVAIIGGGIIGSATAYYLSRDNCGLRIAVIEKDSTYTYASTTLSMANARIQFSFKKNIEISKYAFKILENFEDEMSTEDHQPKISYRREGNLIFVDKPGKENAINALRLQKDLDCRVEWWTPEKVKEAYPIYDSDKYEGATFGADDGHFDAYAVLMGYKNKSKSFNVDYIDAEAAEILSERNRVSGVKLSSEQVIVSDTVINCAGAWASKIAKTAGINLPVIPLKRQVFVLNTAVKLEKPLPLTVLPSGLYFRSDTGGVLLLGKSMGNDPEGFDFSWDDRRFYEILWPELAEFVPAFDTLKLIRGWAGLYAMNTLDCNAILGEWPDMKGLYLANGFSGHGLQQAPAVARYLSELILRKALSLDLSFFGPERILEGAPLCEDCVI